MLRRLRKLLFRIARGHLSSLFIGAAFEHASALMPLERVHDDRWTVIFHHPRPFWKKHLLAVPKRRIPSFAGLQLQDPHIELIVLSLFDGIQHVLCQKELQDAHVLVNGGAYQDVPQIHFHIAGNAAEGKQTQVAQLADYQPAQSSIACYGDAVAFFHPGPIREVHVVLQTRAEIPQLPNWDRQEGVHRQGLLNMLALAQQVIALLALDRYTLVVQESQDAGDRRLTFQLVSGSAK